MVIGGTGGVAWLLGYKSAKLPAWPVWLFAATALIGLCLLLTAARASMQDGHAAELRAVTARLQAVADGDDGDPFRTPQERRMYEAHYSKLAEREGKVKEAVTAEIEALASLTTDIQATSLARFPQPQFWFPAAMATAARQRLRGSDDPRLRITEGSISAGYPMVSGVSAPQISWGSSPIWVPLLASSAANTTQSELDAKVDEVHQWFADIRDTEHALVYRDAVRNTLARRNELARAIAKLDGRAVERNRKCLTCRPIRAWQVWR